MQSTCTILEILYTCLRYSAAYATSMSLQLLLNWNCFDGSLMVVDGRYAFNLWNIIWYEKQCIWWYATKCEFGFWLIGCIELNPSNLSASTRAHSDDKISIINSGKSTGHDSFPSQMANIRSFVALFLVWSSYRINNRVKLCSLMMNSRHLFLVSFTYS